MEHAPHELEAKNRAKKSSQRAGEFGALLVEAKPKMERIGQMLMAAENQSSRDGERKADKPKENREKVNMPEGKNVENLSRSQLLEISDKIVIDGTSLRQIFESRLVGERGLRRLIAEYMRGGDLKDALRREILEREIDFERDPAMRDLDADSDGTEINSKTALDKLLKNAAETVSGANEEAAFYKARSEFESAENDKELQRRRVTDVAFVVTIGVLLVIVITLYLTRR